MYFFSQKKFVIHCICASAITGGIMISYFKSNSGMLIPLLYGISNILILGCANKLRSMDTLTRKKILFRCTHIVSIGLQFSICLNMDLSVIGRLLTFSCAYLFLSYFILVNWIIKLNNKMWKINSRKLFIKHCIFISMVTSGIVISYLI